MMHVKVWRRHSRATGHFSSGLVFALRFFAAVPLVPAGAGLNTEPELDFVDADVAGALESELVVAASVLLEWTSAATATASVPESHAVLAGFEVNLDMI